jgi:pimeloyl-ACP methyl ester carboxylesterase
LSSIGGPSLIIHGIPDPMLPIGDGEALAEDIPAVRQLSVERAGQGVDRADRAIVARAIIELTTPDDGR